MNKLALAAAAASILITGAASAADLPVPARTIYKAPAPIATVYDWTGFYLGVTAGAHVSHDRDNAADTFDNDFIPSAIAVLDQIAPYSSHQTGFAGGVHIGYNWQASTFVFGLEGDFDGLTGTVTRNLIQPFGSANDTFQFTDSSRDNWMSTVRGRAGYAWDRLLIFATGGAAFSNWQISHSFSDAASFLSGAVSETVTRTGWVVGGGVEYALSSNWLIRGEYLHADFGTVSSSVAVPGRAPLLTVFTHPDKLTEDVIRGGISYKFGAPVVARY